MSRVGLLGGAFNPPHVGHIKLAELALAHLELDEVRFIPTVRSPHKEEPGRSPAPEVRLRLLQEALKDLGRPFFADSVELQRGGTSYTVETLEILAAREPQSQWILLVGSDQLPGLSQWVRVERILELASLAVAPRPGFPAAPPPEFETRIQARWSRSGRTRLAAGHGASPGVLGPAGRSWPGCQPRGTVP